MKREPSNLDPMHDALNRMKRAAQRGTGCHLTAAMIEAMERGIFGQIWHEEDPRKASDEEEGE